jgi:hypothetical protein
VLLFKPSGATGAQQLGRSPQTAGDFKRQSHSRIFSKIAQCRSQNNIFNHQRLWSKQNIFLTGSLPAHAVLPQGRTHALQVGKASQTF